MMLIIIDDCLPFQWILRRKAISSLQSKLRLSLRMKPTKRIVNCGLFHLSFFDNKMCAVHYFMCVQ
jgi:hypothetical protein